MNLAERLKDLSPQQKLFGVAAAFVVAYAFYVRKQRQNAGGAAPAATGGTGTENTALASFLQQYAQSTSDISGQNQQLAQLIGTMATGLQGDFATGLQSIQGAVSTLSDTFLTDLKTLNASIDGFKTLANNLPTEDSIYYLAGQNTTAACMNPANGDIDMNCYYLKREVDGLPWCSPSDNSCHDAIAAQIRGKWGSYIKSGKWDWIGVGKAATGGALTPPPPSTGGGTP